MTTDFPEIIDEQKDYYRARAPEYDDWFYRRGRYDLGPEHTQQWEAEAAQVRRKLAEVNLAGQVVEFAAGTGIWTQELLRTAEHVTALDYSPEVLEINRRKTGGQGVTYRQADIFQWQPDRLYDGAFMGFWLSHVPPARLPAFINRVSQALKPGGKLFLVDSGAPHASAAQNMPQAKPPVAEPVMTRRLGDGREFQIIKVYYEPETLAGQFKAAGIETEVQKTEQFFIYGWGQKSS